MATRAGKNSEIVMSEAPAEPKIKHYDPTLSVLRGVFLKRESLIGYTFVQSANSHRPTPKPQISIWSVSFQPQIDTEMYILINFSTMEFHEIKTHPPPTSGTEILWQRLESLMCKKITDDRMSEISCNHPSLKSNLKALVQAGRLSYDSTEKVFTLPYYVPPIETVAELQAKFAVSELMVLYISPNGMLNFNDPTNSVQIWLNSGIYKVGNPRAKTKVKINDRAVLWSNVASNHWREALLCRSSDFTSIDVSPYDVFIFFDRYVHRDDIPIDKLQICCRSI